MAELGRVAARAALGAVGTAAASATLAGLGYGLIQAEAKITRKIVGNPFDGAPDDDGVYGAAPGERPGAVGLVLQEPGSGTVAATVGRDVAFGLENVGVPAGDMPAVVDRCLAAVGLGDLPRTTPTGALSGGQTQRLALAGALALQPAQGGFVEAEVPAAGSYSIVTHAFADMEKGAKGILRATA
mgnify:CR=1 FL=1